MIDETGEEPGAGAARAFRHYDLAMAAFVAILLLSNVIGAGKVATVRLPLLGGWNNEAVFGQVPRVVLASVCAFCGGGRVRNSLREGATEAGDARPASVGTHVLSTIVGQGVDGLIFYPLAFWGAAGWTDALVPRVLVTQ